jgi:serine/threonine-protein kinase
MSDLTGKWLGQYRLDAIIGRGSTAIVYLGHQHSLGRQVAVKVLQPFLDRHFTARFQREAQAIAQLTHPNILPIFDYGEQDGRPYFVTQLIPGGAHLGHSLSGRPMDSGPALALAGYILDALGYAHGRGVIHRDIKPANILLPAPAWPLLADFGIARIVDETTRLTPPGQVLGTAAYLAPERALNRPDDARSDLYAVGVVLYELLTGRLPFEAPTPALVLRGHVYDPPPPPRGLNPALAPELEAVLLRALTKDPDRRYQTAAELAAALTAAGRAAQAPRAWAPPAPPPDPYRTIPLDDLTGAGAPVPAPARQPRPAPARGGLRLNLVWLALGALAALALAALLFWPERRTAGLPGPTQQAQSPIAAADGGPPASPAPAPTTPPTALPLPTLPPLPSLVPTATAAPVVAAPAPPTSAPPPQQAASARTLRLDDEAWTGGFGGAGSPRRYGGRSATWVYGQGTGYDTMRANFVVEGQPAGTATLAVEGMDSEGRARTRIAVRVNGVTIYEGPNPLPDDDLPVETGTWATVAWEFDAALLRPGPNEVSITNQSPGAFSLPPFVMLDYAELRLGAG